METFCVSHNLELLIAAELKQLDLLMGARQQFIKRSLAKNPTTEGLDALAALLHSAYTAMERIMVHIAKNDGLYAEIRAKSFMWHATLLNRMAQPGNRLSSIISKELHGYLNEYLGFRHVFRHAYLHELKWSKMQPLVQNLEHAVRLFGYEINTYLQREN